MERDTHRDTQRHKHEEAESLSEILQKRSIKDGLLVSECQVIDIDIFVQYQADSKTRKLISQKYQNKYFFVQICKRKTTVSRTPLYKSLIKVKQSLCRRGQALRVSGGTGSNISRQSPYEGGKVVIPMHRPPLPTRKYS
jgi:hypothetical protein